MSEEWVQLQADEIEALNSIFDEKQWKQDENDSQRTYRLTVDHRPERAISLDVTFVDGYPVDEPMVYNIRGPWLRGEERQQLTNILEEIYLNNIGKPLVFLWADALRDFVDKSSNTNETVNINTIEPIVDKSLSPTIETILPAIYSDESFEDRKSVFQAHLSSVHSKEEVQLVLNKLKENKKIANATHNMYAYRIWDEKRNVILADCDDDGETGASSRMLHLMDIADVRNVLVVVSRWFGGILLHNDRFKHINNACRMILVNHGYIKKMIIIVYLIFFSVVVSSQQSPGTDLAVVSPNIDNLIDQNVIDEAWEECMITAPATINLLGQIMVVASKVDVSFYHYSPNRVYKHIKYPESFRATLTQISNDGYRAFLGAHSSMGRIQLYMQQIPRHIKTVIKLISSKASPTLLNRLLPKVINNIERIGQTCVTLSRGTENSFVSVMDLLGEVLETTELTRGLTEKELREKDIELNVTRIVHADMKRDEEFRRQRYEEIREAVRKAQANYSRALKDIPTGFKALILDLGRAFIGILKSAGQMYISKKLGGFTSQGQSSIGSTGGAVAFANDQTVNFASHFAQSLNSLIERLPSNDNRTIDDNELKGFKVVFGTYAKLINNIPNNKAKEKASELVQRGVQVVDGAIEDKGSDIKGQLETLANEVKPFMAAEQLSNTNNAPISTSTEGDSSKNELFKAQLTQVRLSETEKRLDEHYAGHIAALEQMRLITEKLSTLNLKVIDLKEVVEMLRKALRLLGQLRQHWHKLVAFFTGLSAKVEAGFGEALKPFLDTTQVNIDLEATEIDRILILELLNDHSMGLYHESYTLYIMSRTYFDVSSKYLMPRIAGLSLMLTADNDDERHRLLSQLQRDTQQVQATVTELVNKRKRMYQKVISEKRALINELIDAQGADGDELDIIKQGKALIGMDDTIDK